MLKWWVGSNGNYFADDSEQGARYCVASAGTVYSVARNGQHIAFAATLDAGKALALQDATETAAGCHGNASGAN